MKTIPLDRQKRNVENVVQNATHLMWLERQLVLHQRWQQWLIVGWLCSFIAIVLLFVVGLPLISRWLKLPGEVMLITAAGVGVELLVLLYLTGRVILRRRAIESEIEQLLK